MEKELSLETVLVLLIEAQIKRIFNVIFGEAVFRSDATTVPESKEDDKDQSLSDLFNVTILLPGGDDIEIQVSSKELVQEIIQVLMEHEDSCHRTCFSLQFEGNVLDNFSELKSVAGLKEGSVLKVVEEPYTIREARIHIRHFRDLLKSLELTDAYNGVDCSSLSFLSSIFEGDIGDSSAQESNGKKKKRPSTEQGLDAIDCSPSDYILPGSTDRPLQPLQPANQDIKPPRCLKSLVMSGWNPPPGNRKMHGDLLYLTVVTMEDHHINITSSNRGFYINQSSSEVFNPKPSSPSHLSHSIVELLNQVSPTFKKNFAALQKKRVLRHPLERIATPYQVFTWVAPSTNHIIDCVRAEDAYNSRLGYEEHIPGQMRDWNEELQTTRELPRELPMDQLLRQRANFKINSDFVGASTRGAMAVIDGNVMAINPGEETKMQMFIWNNIFFSFGFDVRDHYKDLGGDHAAHVASTHDLKGVQAYSDLDIEELYVLGTVVLDYRGYRVTAQSIIPGILDRKEDQSVVYGSIDFGKTVSTSAKYLTLLYKACKPLRILRHPVLDEKDQEVILCSSVECKGIVGNDGRHYILDLLRTFPPDVNFLPLKEEEILSEYCCPGFPKPYRHRLCSLRPELLEVFVQHKYAQFMKIIMERSKNGDLLQPDGSAKDELKGADIVKAACREIGSVSEFIFDIRFNTDVYSPVVRFPESLNKPIQIQKRLMSEAAAFLLTVQIPNFIRACLNHIILPMDGKTLTEALHLYGINMRYLGTVMEMVNKLEARPLLDFLYKILITEIVTRSVKAILRHYLQGVEMSALSAAVSHFLNCFLSSYPNPVAHLPPDELISRKRKNRKKTRPLENGDSNAWASMTPNDLWKQIQKNTKDSFDFTLSCDSVEQLVEKFSLQKLTLLREFCMKTGVQVLLREYNFESRHKPAFTEEDILNMFPVVKHINIKAKEGSQQLNKAQITIQQGNLKEGVTLLNEALAQFNSVYGAVHPEIALCLRLLARVKFTIGDIAEALDNQQKAVIMTERTLGYDSPNAIQDYVLLSHYSFASGQLPVALKLLYRARYIMLLIAGEDHPTMATLDSNIGVILQAVLECDLSLRFLDKALETNRKYYGMKSLDVALSHHLIALAYTSKAEFRAAMQHEKETYTIYKAVLGDSHERTRESAAFLKHVTQQAVNLQRTMNEIYKNGSIATLPHVQIVPPGIESLLQQLNLLNGISRINASDNSISTQSTNQNSLDNIEESIEQILTNLIGGQPKDGDDKKEGSSEQSKEGGDTNDGGEQSKGNGQNDGSDQSSNGNEQNDGGEQSNDKNNQNDSGEQSSGGNNNNDGGDQSNDGDDKKEGGDDDQSKDQDEKKEDVEQSADKEEKNEEAEEQSKDEDVENAVAEDQVNNGGEKLEEEATPPAGVEEKTEEPSTGGEEKKEESIEEQSKDLQEKVEEGVTPPADAKEPSNDGEDKKEESIEEQSKAIQEKVEEGVTPPADAEEKTEESSNDGEEKKEESIEEQSKDIQEKLEEEVTPPADAKEKTEEPSNDGEDKKEESIEEQSKDIQEQAEEGVTRPSDAEEKTEEPSKGEEEKKKESIEEQPKGIQEKDVEEKDNTVVTNTEAQTVNVDNQNVEAKEQGHGSEQKEDQPKEQNDATETPGNEDKKAE
ncbi:clustered mitochondria protein homolog [Gastrophryne carolinensis]